MHMATYSRVYENVTKGNWYRKYRSGSVQKPVNRSMPNPYGVDFWYTRVHDSMYPNGDPNVYASRAYTKMSNEWSNGFGPLEARCYDSIYRQASGGKRAAAALTLLEWESSLTMIFTAAGRLYRSAGKLRAGDIYGSFRELNISDPGRARRMTRQYGDGRRLDRLWLEINFGWAPLIDDIRAMCAVMSQSVPTERISASATGAIDHNRFYDQGRYGWLRESAYGLKRLRYQSRVETVNPNLLLAKQLGLTNPLQVAWDAVPMSFVVDWFLPVNKYLGQFDASLGITLGPLVTSKKAEVYGTDSGRLEYSPSEIRIYSETSYALQFRRSVLGFPPIPKFTDRLIMPSGSLWQAATTAALATTQLIGIRENSRLSRFN